MKCTWRTFLLRKNIEDRDSDYENYSDKRVCMTAVNVSKEDEVERESSHLRTRWTIQMS